MPLTKGNLQFEQLSLGDDFELEDEGSNALSAQERARREDAARSALVVLKQGDLEAWREAGKSITPPDGRPPSWMDELILLLERGFPWRQAVWLAWAASPRMGRWPETQEELATEVLGLTSDRVISTWRHKNPHLDQIVATLQSEMVFAYRGDALQALVASAATPDYKHHPDRKLLLELTGDYVPQAQLKALIASGKFRMKDDVSKMSEEQLLEMAGDIIDGDFLADDDTDE